MKTRRSLLAFTLVELIIVIAIISILASIVVIFINPTVLFQNSRNANRSQDLNSYQGALGRYFSDTLPTNPVRSYDDFNGISTLYASATTTPFFGGCPNGSQGQNLATANSFTIDNSGLPNTVNIQTLLDSGYTGQSLTDPLAKTGYNACVDTSNNNKFIIFSGNTEGNKTPTYVILDQISTQNVNSISTGSSSSSSYNCPSGITYANGNCNSYPTNSVFGAVGVNPINMMIDPSGNIFVANYNSNNVTKITPAGVISIYGTTDTGPSEPVMDAAGNLYVCNQVSNVITKITLGGVSSVFALTDFVPVSMIIDKSGNLYTANLGANDVSKITPGGVSSILGTTDASPGSITIDPDGNIYTTNNPKNTVTKITPNGVSTTFATTGTSPYDIIMDSSRNIYTVNKGSNSVSKITSNGISTIFATTGSTPKRLAIDSFGNLYVTNFGDSTVSKITPYVSSTVRSRSPA